MNVYILRFPWSPQSEFEIIEDIRSSQETLTKSKNNLTKLSDIQAEIYQKSIKNRSKKQAKTRCDFEWILKGSWADFGWILKPSWTPKSG